MKINAVSSKSIRRTKLPTWGLILLATVSSLLLACTPKGPAGPEAPLETEEVSLPPDALVDPTLDVKEVRVESGGLSGQLPSSYPSNLPTYPGASVTDLGEAEPWIEFLVAESANGVARAYTNQLRLAGWTVAGGVLPTDGSTATLQSGTATVRVLLESKGPSTRIVVHY